MHDPEIRDAVRKCWDLSSVRYDCFPGHGVGTRDEKVAWEKELSRNLPGSPGKVLDIGCGTGVMGLLFAGMGHHVTGLDLSYAMLAKARENADAQALPIGLVTGDAEHLPFPDGSFDVVVTRHLVWTLPHPVSALKEWHRVVTPGGIVLIIEGIWNDKSVATRAKRMLSDGLARIFGYTHGGRYDTQIWSQLPYGGGVPEETMRSVLEHAGFTNIWCHDLMYIREMQEPGQPWFRRFASGKTYYLLAATKQPRDSR